MDVQGLQSQLEEVIFWTCRQTIPAETLEIQAIICVTVPSSCHEHVIKIHQTFNKDSLAISKCSFINDCTAVPVVNAVQCENNVAVNSSDRQQDGSNTIQTQNAANITINSRRGKRVYTHKRKFYNIGNKIDSGNNTYTPTSGLKQFRTHVNDIDSDSPNVACIKVETDLDTGQYGGSYPDNGRKDLTEEVGEDVAECINPENSIEMAEYTYSYSIKEQASKSGVQILDVKDGDNYSDDGSLHGSPSELSSSMMAYKITPVIAPGIPSLSPVNDLNLPNSSTKSKWNMRLTTLSNTGSSNELSDDDSNVSATIKRLQCSHCGAMFSSTRTRKRHETTTCGTLKFTCELCSKLYSRKDALRRHMLKMHECEPLDDYDITGLDP